MKSKCNSCGSTNSHDGAHKAGKVIIADIQKRGEMRKDITKKKDDDLSDPEIETPDQVQDSGAMISDYEDDAKLFP